VSAWRSSTRAATSTGDECAREPHHAPVSTEGVASPSQVRAAKRPSPHFSRTFVARQRRVAWMQGARRFRDEGIVETMSRSETVVQRSRQAAICCRSRRSVRNAG
jgi:hypothetical protein